MHRKDAKTQRFDNTKVSNVIPKIDCKAEFYTQKLKKVLHGFAG
jgi:hypothetical protein